MTVSSNIDVRDLNSVRRAAGLLRGRDGGGGRRKPDAARDADVVLGDDWVAPEAFPDKRMHNRPRRRGGLMMLNRSPLARKIITFNLLALIVLVGGVLYLTPSRDNLAFQRANLSLIHI